MNNGGKKSNGLPSFLSATIVLHLSKEGLLRIDSSQFNIKSLTSNV